METNIRLGSQRKGSLNTPLGAVVVRIDRASVLGNPFELEQEIHRHLVVEAHQGWIDHLLKCPNVDAVGLAELFSEKVGLKLAPAWKRPTTRAVIEELYRIQQLAQTQEVWIMCWCAPKVCHGTAYIKAIRDGRVQAAYGWLHSDAASTAGIPDWRQATTPEAIVETRFEYRGGWIKNGFSNMEPFEQPVTIAGVTYTTPENLYQSMKTGDPKLKADLAAMSPYQAKRRAKTIALWSNWQEVKVEVMRHILRRKFAPGTRCHQQLMATGDQSIVEFNNWHDRFWGFCICGCCQGQSQQNQLGVLLMQIRAEYATEGLGDTSAGIAGGAEVRAEVNAEAGEENLGQPSQWRTEPVLRAAPEQIEHLRLNQVFVFGTNTKGWHGKGTALLAFGTGYAKVRGTQGRWAIYGQARGLMQGKVGISYGIETVDLRQSKRSVPLTEIEQQIDELLAFAEAHPELEFLVTAFGTGLAGYQVEEVGKLWQGKPIPSNVRLPQVWIDLL